MRKLCVALLLAALIAVRSAPVWATTGTLTITTNTILSETHNGNIIIAADNITLDCGQHTITGSQPDGAPHSGSGIQLIGRTGVIVSNCLIINFVVGVVLQDSQRNTFARNIVDHNDEEGFDLNDSDENTFVNNVVSINGRDGFDLDNSHGNSFIMNEVHQNTFNGIELDNSDRNVFHGNIVHDNGKRFEIPGEAPPPRSGFSLDGSNANVFIANTSDNNARNGFRIVNSNNNTLILNDATGNQGRDPDPLVVPDRADCKQTGLSLQNIFQNNRFTNPDECIFRLQ